ncbi:MAG: CotH kinase family protein [Zavarzinella sp.]
MKIWFLSCGALALFGISVVAQPPGFGPQAGDRPLVKQFDKDGNDWLNDEERREARRVAATNPGRGGFGPGGRGGMVANPPQEGKKITPDQVKKSTSKDLYDPETVRTIFINFNSPDWEKELSDFVRTDVEVPATVTVDGKKYENVGISYRGMTSLMMVPSGYKKSLNLSVDMALEKQDILGYRTLNLLNAHTDASMMHTFLYSHIARKHIAAPKSNFVRVVINGEDWGLFVNTQQFNKDFLKDFYGSTKGARWKVKGSPNGNGGLEYTGDNIQDYQRRFQIKSKDREEDWKALIELCKVLNTTPPEQLEEKLRHILDIESTLWFIALDVATSNEDGYWTRASDFSIARDEKGVFHIIPHDMNETFRSGRSGPGGFGPGGLGRPGFGPGGPGGFTPPRPTEVMPGFVQEMLGLDAKQRASLKDLQEEIDRSMAKILTKDQQQQMEGMLPGFGPGGPGRGPGGPGGMGGVQLDPLVGITDSRKPLRSKLLAVPALREKYLRFIYQIAHDDFDWKNLQPVVQRSRDLVKDIVKDDVKKLSTYENFLTETDPNSTSSSSLKGFFDARRSYLLNHAEVKKAVGK